MFRDLDKLPVTHVTLTEGKSREGSGLEFKRERINRPAGPPAKFAIAMVNLANAWQIN